MYPGLDLCYRSTKLFPQKPTADLSAILSYIYSDDDEQFSTETGVSQVEYSCRSVLKQRRKKMNKHKYKKWRKRMKFIRKAHGR